MKENEEIPWWREDLPTLGRWAGIIVLASAVGLAVLDFVDLGQPGHGGRGDLNFQLRIAWSRFIGIGVWGVMIVLLAEVVESLQGPPDDDE